MKGKGVFYRFCIVFTSHNVYLSVLNKYDQIKNTHKITQKNKFLSSVFFIKPCFRQK